jgi:hypothetical protein
MESKPYGLMRGSFGGRFGFDTAADEGLQVEQSVHPEDHR